MMNKLTQPLSKRLLFALLIITVGVEIILYLSGYSSLASTIYDAIMVSSFFIGLKIYKRLSTGVSVTKRQLLLQFTSSFLLFFLGSTIINIYSAYAFEDFSIEYDESVQAYTEMLDYEDEFIDPSDSDSRFWAVIDEIDMVGYDIFVSILAGLEEVWRLAYMILILMIFKKLFPRRWEKGSHDLFLMIALFITSILFGIDHTLSTQDSWPYKIGAVVTFANMGLLFGLLLLWTRNLWVTVLVHSVYDIFASISWYYYDYAVEVFAFVVFVVHSLLYILEKRRKLNRFIDSEEIAQ